MTSADDYIGVAGAAGQLGRLVTGALLQSVAAERVALISRTPEKLQRFAALGACLRFGDFDQADSLPAAFDGVSSLLLISTSALGHRVAQHAAAIEAARQAGVRRIVYTSFIGAEPDNPALITQDHSATEAALRASGLEWTILRNAQYAEAILDVIMPTALASGEWRSSSGEGRIAPIARADCAACAAAALLSPDAMGRTYTITGPDLFSYRNIAALIAQAAATAVRFTAVDDEGLYAMFDVLGAPRSPSDVAAGGFPWCSDDMVSFEVALRDGWFEILTRDAESLLGHPPRAFAKLLKDRFCAVRENPAL